MARTVGSSGPKTLEAIREAGLQLIYDYGYDAMSLRQLAAVVGIKQGSLYNHMSTKQDLLFQLVERHMQQLIGSLDTALADVAAPLPRLRAFIDFHVDYHFTRRREVFVSYSELRSLEPQNYATIVGLRKRYERVLVDILEAGVDAGVFMPLDTKVSAYGILGMLVGIGTWFKPGERLSETDVKAIYREMALAAVIGDRQTSRVPRRAGAR